jgi:hypothetical protein
MSRMNLEEIVRTIEEEFTNGQKKRISSDEMLGRLEARGIGSDDRDDALAEAQRRKIMRLRSGFYEWIDPSAREIEKAKIQRYFKALASIFKEGKIDFLPEEDVKAALRKKGYDNEEIDVIFIEAEREHILTFPSRSLTPGGDLVAGCHWVPPEDREREAQIEKDEREFFERWLEREDAQGDN